MLLHGARENDPNEEMLGCGGQGPEQTSLN